MICLLVGLLVMTLLGMRFVDKRLIGAYIALSVAALLIAELAFGISQYLIEFLHKDPTLTDRTRLWADILKIKINPIFGAGFESFWLGDRLVQLHEGRAFQPNEAHNGYLETYINLGLPGLFILIATIGSAYRKIRGGLLREFEFSRFRLGVLAAIVLYNFTEASFTGPQAMWLVFYIIALDYPRVEYEPAAEEINVVEYEGDAELSYFEERL
jgi:O-antigen ligase